MDKEKILISRFRGVLMGFAVSDSLSFPFRNFTKERIVEIWHQQEIISNDEHYLAFISKYGKVATKEISEVFSIPMEKTFEKLEHLANQNKITRNRVGNGDFWQSK